MDLTCRAQALAAGEALAGTALEQTTRWLLLELPGPWASKPLESAAIPQAARTHIASALAETPGSRLQLLRRTKAEGAISVKLVRSGPQGGSVHSLTLEHLEDIVDIDISALWETECSAVQQPLILVCAHGIRDQCCAREGAPMAHALAQLRPQSVWQTSHLGGHRFAATAVILPSGAQLGRLEPDEAEHVWRAADEGVIHRLDRYRGNTAWTKQVQAAAIHVRTELGLMQMRDLSLVDVQPLESSGSIVRFQTPQGPVDVQTCPGQPGPQRKKGCTAAESSCASPIDCQLMGL